MEKSKNILETVRAASNLKTFARAVKAAGLEETLKAKGPYTVFAPTDEAFEKLPQSTLSNLMKAENKKSLADLIRNHVANGKTMTAGLKTPTEIKSLGKATLKVKSDARGVSINTARVSRGDIACSNGVIHAIDAVTSTEAATTTV